MNKADRNILEELAKKLKNLEIRGVSIDSRTVREGELFVALRGDRFDGHDFVSDAVKKGAWGALVEQSALRLRDACTGLKNVIYVENTLGSLQELALLHRMSFPIPVVAVTGTNGKTTTKEMTAAILGRSGPVLKTEGNLNNHIGVPLTLLRLGSTYKSAVVEMGMSGRGEIALLARIACPVAGVITNIGPAHLEFLGSIDAVAEAKAELLAALPQDGVAVLNADDAYFDRLQANVRSKIISFGLGEHADVRAMSIRQEGDGTEFVLIADGQTTPVRLQTVGRHNVYNAVAAAAAALSLGVSHEAVKQGLEEFRPVAMRSELKNVKGLKVLADYYNANPASVAAALETLASLGGDRVRTIAVLGDMLELGSGSAEAHREIGRTAARLGIGLVVAVGPSAGYIAEGAKAAGMSDSQVVESQNASQAAAVLRERTHPGDRVLIKGSRGMKLEKVLEEF